MPPLKNTATGLLRLTFYNHDGTAKEGKQT